MALLGPLRWFAAISRGQLPGLSHMPYLIGAYEQLPTCQSPRRRAPGGEHPGLSLLHLPAAPPGGAWAWLTEFPGALLSEPPVTYLLSLRALGSLALTKMYT